MEVVRPLPTSTVPPPRERSDSLVEAHDSGEFAHEAESLVAVAVDDPALDRDLRSRLAGCGLIVAGADLAGRALAVVVEGAGVAAARTRVRNGAAIVAVVMSPAEAEAAFAAGAFGCVHSPVAAAELAGLVRSALGARAAHSRAAYLERKLDLEAHMASIGRMSAGLTHELSNPLSIAGLSLEYLRSRLAEAGGGRLPDDLDEPLDDLARSIERIEALVVGLRPFVSGGEVTLRPMDVAPVVTNALRWAGATLAGVDLEERVECQFAMADATLLEQVVINLATNAAFAARALPSPRMRVRLYRSAGDVVVSVRDNGPGIAPELQERIFEPFFTTRRGKGGSGLGLSLCREYARRMQASLSLWSAPGMGACFRLRLRPA